MANSHKLEGSPSSHGPRYAKALASVYAPIWHGGPRTSNHPADRRTASLNHPNVCTLIASEPSGQQVKEQTSFLGKLPVQKGAGEDEEVRLAAWASPLAFQN